MAEHQGMGWFVQRTRMVCARQKNHCIAVYSLIEPSLLVNAKTRMLTTKTSGLTLTDTSFCNQHTMFCLVHPTLCCGSVVEIKTCNFTALQDDFSSNTLISCSHAVVREDPALLGKGMWAWSRVAHKVYGTTMQWSWTSNRCEMHMCQPTRSDSRQIIHLCPSNSKRKIEENWNCSWKILQEL